MDAPEAAPPPDAASNTGPNLWELLPANCQEQVLGLLNQQSMAVLACVARPFRDHVRGVRLRKRTLILTPGESPP